MYHPFEPGVFWQESHWPEVRIYRKEMVCEIRLHVLPMLAQQFQEDLPDQQHYNLHYNRNWAIYTFSLYAGHDEQNRERIRALNILLELVSIFGSDNKYETTRNHTKAQIAFVTGNNPSLTEDRFGACEVCASFSLFGTTYCQEADRHALEEYVSSRMKGVYKILFPGSRRCRDSVCIHLQQSNLPVLWTDNVNTLLGVTGNQIDDTGGFSLTPQNVDSHFQQCILLVGVLVLWQRMRQARLRQDPTIDALPAMPET